jgi:hypothetical protein
MWEELEFFLKEHPYQALKTITMENNNSTTLLHQVITSKSSNMRARWNIINLILTTVPNAASIPNGYGSLPLHVVSQRNIKMDASMKEEVILHLIDAYPSALLSLGGVGKRTPLHIAFTDYLSSGLIQTMIQRGKEATEMKDKNGWLPIHVACSRHCSPEKLEMLLKVYPDSLHEKTLDGETPMSLATSTATSSHPNHKLIKALQCSLKRHQNQQSRIRPSTSIRDAPTIPRKRKGSHNIQKVQESLRTAYSEEDKEQAWNLLLLQSGCYLNDHRNSPGLVTPSNSFPYFSYEEVEDTGEYSTLMMRSRISMDDSSLLPQVHTHSVWKRAEYYAV